MNQKIYRMDKDKMEMLRELSTGIGDKAYQLSETLDNIGYKKYDDEYDEQSMYQQYAEQVLELIEHPEKIKENL